jgi:hypothetical protein
MKLSVSDDIQTENILNASLRGVPLRQFSRYFDEFFRTSSNDGGGGGH